MKTRGKDSKILLPLFRRVEPIKHFFALLFGELLDSAISRLIVLHSIDEGIKQLDVCYCQLVVIVSHSGLVFKAKITKKAESVTTVCPLA